MKLSKTLKKILLLLFAAIPMISFGESQDDRLYRLGIESFNNRRYYKARDYFSKAADMNKKNVWARFYYVYSLVMLNEQKEAQKWVPALSSLSKTRQYKDLMKLMNPVKEPIKPPVKEKKESTTMTFETSTLNLETKTVSSSNYGNERNSASKKSKGEKKSEKSLVDEAKLLIDSDETDKAIELLNSEIMKNVKNGQAYELLGVIYYNKQDYKNCARYMNSAFSNGVDNFDSYFMAAESSANLQKTEDAFKWYLKANEKNKNDIFVKLALADIYCNKAEYKKADSIYKDILAKEDDNLEAKIGLANIDFEKGFNNIALDKVDNILNEVPASSKARFLKARILLDEKKYEPALEEAKLAYSYNPANVEYRVFASLVKVRNILIKEAIEELNELLNEYPSNVYVLVTLGEALLTDNKIKEGKEVLLKADIIKKIPQTSELLALVEASEGNYDAADVLYKEFCKRSGNNPRSLLAYAEFLEIKQDKTLSIKAYNAVKEKFPGTPFAKKAEEALKKINGLTIIKSIPVNNQLLYH